jgi:hypothetical protein
MPNHLTTTQWNTLLQLRQLLEQVADANAMVEHGFSAWASREWREIQRQLAALLGSDANTFANLLPQLYADVAREALPTQYWAIYITQVNDLLRNDPIPDVKLLPDADLEEILP